MVTNYFFPENSVKKEKQKQKKKEAKGLFGLEFFITQFPSLNFHHSSLITHHS